MPQRKFISAIIKQCPTDAKVPDAKLKLAMMAAANQQTAAAEQQLQDIIKQYPNSVAANLAATQLRQLKGQLNLSTLKITEIFYSLQGETDTVDYRRLLSVNRVSLAL